MCHCRMLFLFPQCQKCCLPARPQPEAWRMLPHPDLSFQGHCFPFFPSHGPEKHALSIFYSLSCNHMQQMSTKAKALWSWVPTGFGTASRGHKLLVWCRQQALPVTGRSHSQQPGFCGSHPSHCAQTPCHYLPKARQALPTSTQQGLNNATAVSKVRYSCLKPLSIRERGWDSWLV